jgi:hypothetical protein
MMIAARHWSRRAVLGCSDRRHGHGLRCPAPRRTARHGNPLGSRIGRARTPAQDVDFSVLLLEEMAVRALSPSTNDPYTAVNALDQLAAGVVPLAGRRTPSANRYDDEDHLRVIAPHVSVIDVLEHVLEAMRLYALQHPSVLRRTLRLVEQVAAASVEHESRDRLAVQVQRLLEAMAHGSLQACDGRGATPACGAGAAHAREPTGWTAAGLGHRKDSVVAVVLGLGDRGG